MDDSDFRDMKKALNKHRKGELDKEYYAPDGSVYPSVILKGKDPKKAHEIDKKRTEAKKEKIKKEYKEGKRRLVHQREIANR